MAKQLINVGSQANDGTGDSIRSGAQKINSVINELYNELGDSTNLQISISNVTSGNVLRSNGTDFVSSQLSYSDLSDTPTIPAAQVPSDWNATTGASRILNKPVLFSGSYNDLTDKPALATVSTSGSYNDLTNKPALATVSTSGSYNDLTNKPSLFSGSYNDLTNKPTLAAVATSGSYNDLTNKPALVTVATSGSYNDLINKPTLSTVATTGSYADLTSIPESSLSSRGTVSVTTGLLNNDQVENLSIIAHKSYLLLKITTNIASRVVIYTTIAARTSDSARSEATPPTANSGVIADITTTGSQTITLTPGVIGFNNDTIVSTNMYLKVINKSGQQNNVDVTFTLLKLED